MNAQILADQLHSKGFATGVIKMENKITFAEFCKKWVGNQSIACQIIEQTTLPHILLTKEDWEVVYKTVVLEIAERLGGTSERGYGKKMQANPVDTEIISFQE